MVGGSGPEEVQAWRSGDGHHFYHHDGGDHDHDHDDDYDTDHDDNGSRHDDNGRGVGRAQLEESSRGEEDCPRPLAGKAGTLRPSPWCPLNSSFLLLLVRSVWTSPRSYQAASDL